MGEILKKSLICCITGKKAIERPILEDCPNKIYCRWEQMESCKKLVCDKVLTTKKVHVGNKKTGLPNVVDKVQPLNRSWGLVPSSSEWMEGK